MSRFTNITSAVIKRRLTHTLRSNRQYIDDLIHLHRYLRNQPRQWTAALLFSLLRKKYPTDYLELLIEESQGLYEKEIQRLSNKAEQSVKHDISKRNKLDALRNGWLLTGGME
jgi:hypothetical protein